MSLDFADPEFAAQLDSIIRKTVRAEIDKNRPAPRYAVVNSINLAQKYCMVTYTGETDSVRVPFNTVIPNEVGQEVRIEGTPGDRYITAIRGTSKLEQDTDNATGAAQTAQEQAQSASEAAEAASNQANNVEAQLFTRTTRPLYRGLNPTGESSFDYQLLSEPGLHNHSAGFTMESAGSHSGHDGTLGTKGSHTHEMIITVGAGGTSEIAVTASLLHMPFIKCEMASRKDVLYFKARRTNDLTTCYADIYIMEDDGSWTWKATTANLALDITTSKGWIVVNTDAYVSSPKDIIGVQFRPVGAGTLYLDGRRFPIENYPNTVRPLNVSMARTTNSAPASIAASEADSRYSYLLAYVEYGQLSIPAPAPRDFFENFNSVPIGTSFPYAAKDQGEHLSISNGELVNPSNQLLTQRAMRFYKSPVNTDVFEVEWTVRAIDGDSIAAGIVLFGSSTMQRFATVQINKNEVEITTAGSGIGNSQTQRAITSTTGNNGRWRATFDINDNRTLKIYKPGSPTVPIVQWSDTGNYLFMGKGNRLAGCYIEHGSFKSAGILEDFAYRDWIQS
ncbi:minor tail protein [Gordonia phage Kampe]|uniref:Minor tail protein n=3 Tax=Gordonia phage Orchid TaxID=1838075 RepID=A0A160DHD1_9CAUD|nr:minor tail protein [Gordonia phage Orchid]ANA87261.1 minor tail protein [Gordonia phage PatrickStar]ANA87374.1 minor tail protein [Gordonia phage Orchid]ANA87488.1 minor tail protein [Gordonia phage Kampe]